MKLNVGHRGRGEDDHMREGRGEIFCLSLATERDPSTGDVAHMVERSLSMREVWGSIPHFSKFFLRFFCPIFFACECLSCFRKIPHESACFLTVTVLVVYCRITVTTLATEEAQRFPQEKLLEFCKGKDSLLCSCFCPCFVMFFFLKNTNTEIGGRTCARFK